MSHFFLDLKYKSVILNINLTFLLFKLGANISTRGRHGFGVLHIVASQQTKTDVTKSDPLNSKDTQDLCSVLYNNISQSANKIENGNMDSHEQDRNTNAATILMRYGADVALMNDSGHWPGLIATGVCI